MRRCLKLNKTGLYPEEVTAAKDRDKDGTVPHGHDYMCSACVFVCVFTCIKVFLFYNTTSL